MKVWNDKRVLVAIASVALALAWVAPGLWGLAIHITDHDTALYYYPLFDFYARALQSGQSFLWVPGMLSGFPAYASQVAGFLDPFNLVIFSFFDGFTGTHIRIFFDIVLTFTFSYLASRSLGISRTASALVGPSFLIAFHTRFISNPLIANTLFLVPLLMYVASGVLDSTLRKRSAIALLGLGVGSTLLAGYTQIVLYALLAAGVYTIVRILLEKRESFRSIVAKGWVICAGIACGILIGLPFIIPALSLLPQSARSESVSYADATRKVVALGDFALIAVPDHFYIPYVTAGRKPLYVGALWNLFAIAALAYVATRFARKKYVPFNESRLAAVGVTALFLLLCSVAYSPLYYLLSKLPLFELFRFPYRFMYVGAFFLALLGAFGFDRFAIFLRERTVRVVLYVALACYAALLGFIIISNILSERIGGTVAEWVHTIASAAGLYSLLGMSKGSEHYAGAIERGISAYRELLSFSDMNILLPTLVLGLSVATMLAFMRQRISNEAFRRSALIVSCATVLMIPVLRYEQFYHPENAGAAPHLALDYANENDVREYRFYSFLANAAVSNAIPPQYKLSEKEMDAVKKLTVRAGVPNYHLHHGMKSIDGYDQFETTDMLTAMEAVGGELYAGYGAGTYEERTQRLLANPGVLAMMGAKYVISGVELRHPRLVLRGEERITDYNLLLRLYEVANPYPIVYMPRVVYGEPHENFMSLYASSSRAFEGEVYLDCELCSKSGGGVIENHIAQNGLHVVDVKGGGYLVLSESYLPGWVASIDGEPVSIVRANGLFMAVYVPSGNHRVRFEYQGLNNELPVLKWLGVVGDI